jgi:hypothetical protein
VTREGEGVESENPITDKTKLTLIKADKDSDNDVLAALFSPNGGENVENSSQR